MDNRDTVRHKVAETLGVDAGRIDDDAVLSDLVPSSFMLVEMVIEIQEEFGVRFVQADLLEVQTAGQFLDLVTSRMAASQD